MVSSLSTLSSTVLLYKTSHFFTNQNAWLHRTQQFDFHLIYKGETFDQKFCSTHEHKTSERLKYVGTWGWWQWSICVFFYATLTSCATWFSLLIEHKIFILLAYATVRFSVECFIYLYLYILLLFNSLWCSYLAHFWLYSI